MAGRSRQSEVAAEGGEEADGATASKPPTEGERLDTGNGSVHQVAADAARPDQTTLSATLMEHVVIMPQVELPQELIEKFEKSGFCPHDAVRGRPETGTAWNTLEIEYDPGSESSYSGTSMFYVCHWNGKTTKAERPWGEMSGKHDGEFIKAVVDWFQSMTQARS